MYAFDRLVADFNGFGHCDFYRCSQLSHSQLAGIALSGRGCGRLGLDAWLARGIAQLSWNCSRNRGSWSFLLDGRNGNG